MADTEELLVEKIQNWKKSMEEKRFRENLGKTKFMKCEARFDTRQNRVPRFDILCHSGG